MKILGKRLNKYVNAYDEIKAGDIIAFYYHQTNTYKNPTSKPLVSYYKVKKKEHGGLLIKYLYGKKGMHSKEKGFDDDWQWLRISYTEGYIYKLSENDKLELFAKMI